MTADELEAFFISDRPGGQGQRDIWTATRTCVDEDFTVVRNVAEINTLFHRRFPEHLGGRSHALLVRLPGRHPTPRGHGRSRHLVRIARLS
jgi:hypothetical protein